MAIKAKSSEVLQEALSRILDGRQRGACAAIQDVETDLRYEHNDEIRSNAAKIFARFRPKWVQDGVKNTQEWWPVGDDLRVEALRNAISIAVKNND